MTVRLWPCIIMLNNIRHCQNMFVYTYRRSLRITSELINTRRKTSHFKSCHEDLHISIVAAKNIKFQAFATKNITFHVFATFFKLFFYYSFLTLLMKCDVLRGKNVKFVSFRRENVKCDVFRGKY